MLLINSRRKKIGNIKKRKSFIFLLKIFFHLIKLKLKDLVFNQKLILILNKNDLIF